MIVLSKFTYKRNFQYVLNPKFATLIQTMNKIPIFNMQRFWQLPLIHQKEQDGVTAS